MTVTNLLLTVPIFSYFFHFIFALINGSKPHKYWKNSMIMRFSMIQFILG